MCTDVCPGRVSVCTVTCVRVHSGRVSVCSGRVSVCTVTCVRVQGVCLCVL